MSSPDPTSRRALRARVSRRRFMARRTGALAAIVLVAVVLVRAVGALGGSDEPSVVEASDAPGTSVSSAAPAAADLSADTLAPSTTTGTVPEPEHTGPPTSEHPATVLIVGDSDAGTFGPYLEQLLDETGVIETVLDYKVSSGLARPDFYDWPTEMRAKVPAADPDIVVVTFGGNDAQGLADTSGDFLVGEPRSDSDNAEWRAEYGARVGEVMDFLVEDGRTVIWVGIPNDDNPDVTFRMRVQDETAKAEAAKRPGVVFVDTWGRFAGRNGGWAEFVVDPRDGVGKDVRADDGFHLNTTGAEILALEIAQSIRADLAARGANI